MLPDLLWHDPALLWLLLLVPAVGVLSWREQRRRAALLFSATPILASGHHGLRARLQAGLPVIRMLALTLAVVALARPQTHGARTRDLSVEGIDIVIALDLSTSMEAVDFRPQNRITVAKETLSDFISSRVNDRIGLVVFAGAAYTQAPLTLDYGVLKEVVKQLRTRVLEDGTAIGDAIAVSLNRLRDSDAKSKVIVLITDGDNNAGKISPLDAAAMAKALHVPVFTILVGKGGRVPFPDGTDLFGNPSYRELDIAINPDLLKAISRETGGTYYRATDRESLQSGLRAVLDRLDKSKLLEGGAMANMHEEFPPFLLLGFLLAAAELLLRTTWLRVFP
ncbi:MAG TPA: VWA domain-containing protein [Myxococcaceae bacterium]|nr:VWA domain-containing protein [Myxococcaceae bacterium]